MDVQAGAAFRVSGDVVKRVGFWCVHPSQVMVAQNALLSFSTEHQGAAPTISRDSTGILLQ